jgi:hypothetical protein
LQTAQLGHRQPIFAFRLLDSLPQRAEIARNRLFQGDNQVGFSVSTGWHSAYSVGVTMAN